MSPARAADQDRSGGRSPSVRLAIPIQGKMAMRSFHMGHFRQALEEKGLAPVYFLAPEYFQALELDPDRYRPLDASAYQELLRRHPLAEYLADLRHFLVITGTTDLRLREYVEQGLFNTHLCLQLGRGLVAAGLRHLPGLGRLALAVEHLLLRPRAHLQALVETVTAAALTPGMGSFGFWSEGLFAREARRLGLPVVSAITNYDNIVNRGYPGFIPDKLAVWSQVMADDVRRLTPVPARRIEITGPLQFDRYFEPLPVSRAEFLASKGLDPARKTVLYAGGVNITKYFEIYELLAPDGRLRSDLNLIVRPYPHPKLLTSPAWRVLEGLWAKVERVYLSNPLTASADRLKAEDLRRDFADAPDELHCLLKYSDVMINYFSTISLESAICDLPTIHVGFDDYAYGLKFHTLTAFQLRQTHNKRPRRLAAARVARSKAELLTHLESYLADHDLEKEARREYALSECGWLDGRASERLAGLLAAAVAGR